jgi:hypothetical protein
MADITFSVFFKVGMDSLLVETVLSCEFQLQQFIGVGCAAVIGIIDLRML